MYIPTYHLHPWILKQHNNVVKIFVNFPEIINKRYLLFTELDALTLLLCLKTLVQWAHFTSENGQTYHRGASGQPANHKAPRKPVTSE